MNGDGTFGDATGVGPTLTWAQLVALNIKDGPAAFNNVKVRVNDVHGHIVDSPATSLTVQNTAPTAGIGGAPNLNGNVGQSLSVTFSATDPSPVDQAATFSYAITWGDGSPVQTVTGPNSKAVSHTYGQIGVYPLSVTATDKDGGLSAAATASVTIGGTQLVADPCTSGATALVVGGTAGNDIIKINAVSGSSKVQVVINGVVIGTFSPTGHIIVFGQAGDDTITVDNKISIPRIMYGNDGNDTMQGGNGSSILIGGPGDDTLSSGNAPDILIGGTGKDTLNGGNGDDILIAGSTSYDNATSVNQVALCRILAEWTRTDISYSARIAHLTGATTGGLNGTNYLKGPGAGQTVFDDTSVDKLTGGMGQDWFLLNIAGGGTLDTSDRTSSEVATDL